jgi:hypothetical protein
MSGGVGGGRLSRPPIPMFSTLNSGFELWEERIDLT